MKKKKTMSLVAALLLAIAPTFTPIASAVVDVPMMRVSGDSIWAERYVLDDRELPNAIWVSQGNYSGYLYNRGDVWRNGGWHAHYTGYLLRGPYAELVHDEKTDK